MSEHPPRPTMAILQAERLSSFHELPEATNLITNARLNRIVSIYLNTGLGGKLSQVQDRESTNVDPRTGHGWWRVSKSRIENPFQVKFCEDRRNRKSPPIHSRS